MKQTKKFSEVSFRLSECSGGAESSTRRDSSSHYDSTPNIAATRKRSLQWIYAVNSHFENQDQQDKKSKWKLISYIILLTLSLYLLMFSALYPVVIRVVAEFTSR